MLETVKSYQSYLENDRGFTKETVKKYMSNLRIMFTRMKIFNYNQLTDTVINKRLLDDFWLDLQANKPISDATRLSYLSTLKSFIKFCFDIGKLDTDISEKIVMPKLRQLYKEGLSKKEQHNLREYIATNLKTEKDLRNAALIMFLWGTATRISEALNLNCHPDGYIYFHDESIMSGDFHMSDGKMYVHIKGKNKRDRKIIVSDDVLAYLNTYLHERKNRNDILFQNMYNRVNKLQRLSRIGAAQIIDDIFKKCGILREKDVITHTFRHTAINHWIEMGISDQQIITMTGHSQPSGLDPYHKRNKKLTDVFGDKAKATGTLDDNRLKTLEELMRKRHSTQRLSF